MNNDKTYCSAEFVAIFFCDMKSCSTLDIYHSFGDIDYLIL